MDNIQNEKVFPGAVHLYYIKNHKIPIDTLNCNCNKKECPLPCECLTSAIVYQAEVKTSEETTTYIGITGGTFKQRLNNHKKSLKNKKYKKQQQQNYQNKSEI